MRIELSENAHLRPVAEPDAEELHALIEANREQLARWLPWAATQTRDDTVAFIRRSHEQRTGDSGLQMAVVCGGSIAGAIGYPSIDWQHRTTSIGYWLGEDYQGRGTMTAAVRALVDHAVGVWDLNRVEIRAAAGNHRSRAIPERLGFRQEGTLRQAECVGGRYLDRVLYAMLASEWKPHLLNPSPEPRR